MEKHTPGPWHRNIKPATRYPTIFAGRNTHVCSVSSQPDPETFEANLVLIQHAPDLLAAAKLTLLLLDDLETRGAENFVEQAALRQAIAKAEGRT